MSRLFKNRSAWAVALLLSSCGTNIDTGRNAKHRKQRASSGTLNSFSESSCFGSSAEEVVGLDVVCQALPAAERSHFDKLLKGLCDDKKATNLFRNECGWDGSKQDAGAYLRALEHTDLKNQATHDFYYLSAYSLTVRKTKQSLKQLLFLAFSQPAFFQENYIFPKNTKVTPHPAGVEKVYNNAEKLVFDMDITGSVGATRFVNEMIGYDAGSGVEVVTERLLEAREGIKSRRSLQISRANPDGTHKIVVFEEYTVPDRGLHDIALELLYKHDLNRMKLFIDNAEIEP